jgi:hypothetical protein
MKGEHQLDHPSVVQHEFDWLGLFGKSQKEPKFCFLRVRLDLKFSEFHGVPV